MKNIIIFPGQGYQNMGMLTSEVQQFCNQNGLYTVVDEVLRDNSKLFDTQYAQPLIVATQLAEYERYKRSMGEEKDTIFLGFSLGEITALIAANTISVEEGIKFAMRRGEESKKITQIPGKEGVQQTAYGVVKLPYTTALQNCIEEWNNKHLKGQRVDITNYLPRAGTVPCDNQIQEDVTITGEYEMLKDNLEVFGGEPNQKMAKMQCPFHSIALDGLVPIQKEIFRKTITDINTSKIHQVYSTRTGEFYSSDLEKEDLSEALARYIVEPIQTTKTLRDINEQYNDGNIVVMMGEEFTNTLKKQYQAIGGDPEKINFIGDYQLAKRQDSLTHDK